MTPLLASKIVFVLGIVMLMGMILRKLGVVRAVKVPPETEETFFSFVVQHFEVVRHHISGAYHIFARWLLRGSFASLHALKLASLKLESRATQLLGHVQKVSEKVRIEKEKQTTLEEVVVSTQKQSDEDVTAKKRLNSGEFFSILKDSPNHDKLRDKLSVIKEETKQSEQK